MTNFGDDSHFTPINLRSFTGHYWNEVTKKLKRSVVFIDEGIKKVLHFNGGKERLLENGGAIDVRSFSSFEIGQKEELKAVFLLHSSLTGLTLDILHEVLRSSSFEYVQVITTAPETTHPGEGYFYNLEADILEWMGNPNFTAEIFHFPLNLSVLNEEVFITPGFDDVYPEFESTDSLEELKPLYEEKLRRLASFFASFFGLYDVKEDVFGVGEYSCFLGDFLSKITSGKARRKNSASIILVDRNKDLLTPSEGDGGCILETLLNHSLDPENLHDSLVSMKQLFNTKRSDSVPKTHLLKRTLHSTIKAEKIKDTYESIWKGLFTDSKDQWNKRLLNNLDLAIKNIPKKETLSKEALNFVKKAKAYNVQCTSSDGWQPLRDLTKESNRLILQDIFPIEETDELNDKVNKFCLNETAIYSHCDLLKLAISTRSVSISNLKDPLEDVFTFLNSSKPFLDILEKLINLVRDTSISINDLLRALSYAYSARTNNEQLEEPEAIDKIQSLLLDRLVENRINGLEIPDELNAHRIIKNIFFRLSNLRGGSYQYLKKLTSKIYSEELDTVEDLKYRSGGSMGGKIINSGLSWFGLSVDKGPHPRENPIIIIFVVGGISPGEIASILSIAKSSNSKAQVIIGSTCLLHRGNISMMYSASIESGLSI